MVSLCSEPEYAASIAEPLRMITYNLSIKVVLLDHHDVDSPWVLECEEAEASRSAGCSIAHDSALENLAELREILLQRL